MIAQKLISDMNSSQIYNFYILIFFVQLQQLLGNMIAIKNSVTPEQRGAPAPGSPLVSTPLIWECIMGNAAGSVSSNADMEPVSP